MRPAFRILVPMLVLVALASGCGTLVNLTAPPASPTAYRGMGPSTCEPFGGVSRSVLLGGLCAVAGLNAGDPLAGSGMMLAGLGILAVEVPLSLVGDVVTLPLVHARRGSVPWAPWWGEQPGQPGTGSPQVEGHDPAANLAEGQPSNPAVLGAPLSPDNLTAPLPVPSPAAGAVDPRLPPNHPNPLASAPPPRESPLLGWPASAKRQAGSLPPLPAAR